MGEKIITDKKILKIDFSNLDKSLLMANKIKQVEELGLHLKSGRYDDLFQLVEILNQSDPNQNYLIDAEEIFLARYKENKNTSDLYSMFISQILQRKINKTHFFFNREYSKTGHLATKSPE